MRFFATVGVVFRGGGILFLLPPSLFFFSVFGFLFVVVVFFCYLSSTLGCCSILLRQLCCCPELLTSFPFWSFAARRSLSSMKQPESILVLRWVLINLRSTYLRSTRAYTHHSTVTTDLSALHRHLMICYLHCTCQDVSSTR